MREIAHAALRLCVDNSSDATRKTPRSSQAANSLKCQEPGISRRVRHLRTCQSDAPLDFAASAMSDQRSFEKMSGRGDDPCIIPFRDRSSPLSRPTIPLRTNSASRCLGMAEGGARYRVELSKRMRAARLDAGYSQAEMAIALRLSTTDQYKKMEQRGALPTWLVEPFALQVNEDVFYILTGRREKPDTAARPRKRRSAA